MTGVKTSGPSSEWLGNYVESRARFREVAELDGVPILSWQVPGKGPAGESLTIDMARWGRTDAKRLLVVTAGLHGVETPLGMVALLAARDIWLRLREPDDLGLLLVHALNPFGFAWHRRWDQEGIDLNRNFYAGELPPQGANPEYLRLDSLLNPSRFRRFDGFSMKAIAAVLREGMPVLQRAVAAGQYERPRGVFFGGAQPSWLRRRLEGGGVEEWLGESRQVLHIDVHTGLGPWAKLQLIPAPGAGGAISSWCMATVRGQAAGVVHESASAYEPNGAFGTWLGGAAGAREYAYLCAEVGTYGPVRTLSALRSEQAQWLWGAQPPGADRVTGRRLREVFFPRSVRWRERSREQIFKLLESAIENAGSGRGEGEKRLGCGARF